MPEVEPQSAESSSQAAPEAPPRPPMAVSLMSGGLDSQVAARMLAEQGVQVRALTFMTPFGCGPGEGGACGHDPAKLPIHPSIRVKLANLGQEYIDMVMNPKHGYGSQANPCIDCRAMMLRWAKDYAETVGADFLATGEVLHQRPMSQRRGALSVAEQEAGVEGMVLRPLSARLLPETEAERRGLVDRSQLGAISGRSRRPQMELAKKLGIEKYPTPGGGCLLTDPAFARRFFDLKKHQSQATVADVDFMKIGRHFRLSPTLKLVIGRDESDNGFLKMLREPGDAIFYPEVQNGPTAVARRPKDTPWEEAEIDLICRLVAAFGKGAVGESIEITWGTEPEPSQRRFVAKPADRSEFEAFLLR